MFKQQVSANEPIVLAQETTLAVSLFGAMNPQQLRAILDLMTVRKCHAGEHLFYAGDLPSNIYILLHGRVDLIVEQEGVHCLRKSFKVGETIGETAVIGIQKQVGTAIASSDDVELLELSHQALLDIHAQDKELFCLLMMNIARDVCRKLHAQ